MHDADEMFSVTSWIRIMNEGNVFVLCERGRLRWRKKGSRSVVCVVGWKTQIKIVCWWQIFMMFSRFFHPTLSVDDILNTFQHTKMFSNFPSPNSKRKREKNDADDEEKKRKKICLASINLKCFWLAQTEITSSSSLSLSISLSFILFFLVKRRIDSLGDDESNDGEAEVTTNTNQQSTISLIKRDVRAIKNQKDCSL